MEILSTHKELKGMILHEAKNEAQFCLIKHIIEFFETKFCTNIYYVFNNQMCNVMNEKINNP